MAVAAATAGALLTVASAPQAQATEGYISNPTCGTDTSGWEASGNAGLSRVVESGASACQAKPAVASGTKNITLTSAPSIATITHPGTTVHVALQSRVSEAGKEVSLQMQELAADGSVVQSFVDARSSADTYRWFGAQFTTQRPNSKVRVKMTGKALSGQNYLRVKNVTFTVTPPPPLACESADFSDPAQGRLTFSDEFDGTSLDTSKWRVRSNTYLDFDAAYIKSANVTVSDGKLNIRGERMATPVAVTDGAVKDRYYSTGYVDTIDKFSQQYGRWEMRARLPTDSTQTRGVWPAFWLRGDNTLAEIDIMESYGSPDSRGTAFDPAASYEWTIWKDTTKASGNERLTQWAHPGGHTPKVYEDYHVYGVNWSPECLTFTFDKDVVGHVAVDDVPWMEAALNSPFNIRLNMQVGSSYWGMPDTTNTKNQFDYSIDYVRVYQAHGR